MTTAYWNQWSHDELMSMHGIENIDQDNEEDIDRDQQETERKKHDCGRCLDCLGLSWSDFI